MGLRNVDGVVFNSFNYGELESGNNKKAETVRQLTKKNATG